MSRHPLIDRAAEKAVRQSKGFREVAAALTGEALAADYAAERAGAPRRSEGGRRSLVAPNQRLASAPRPGREPEHAAIALVRHRKEGAPPLPLPDDGTLEALHAGAVLKSAAPEKSLGADDPNYGIDKVDLLAAGPDDRLAVVVMRWLPADAKRLRTGDTPLRALLEGLAHAAVAEANLEALVAELDGAAGRPLEATPPSLILLGSPRYWELSRKREAQRGAAWIRELERLGREIEDALSMPVRFLSLKVDALDYADGSPRLTGMPRLVDAWEPGAGRVKPKARPRPKRATVPAEEKQVEADLSRPVRSYELGESYLPGDRIQHAKLGLGVVQGLAGPGKIRVRFDDRKSVLVHERSAS